MIKFASSVIEVGKLFPKVERPKFVKVSQVGDSMADAEPIMTQEEAMAKWLPEIQENGKHYYKFAQVRARKATSPSEKVVTFTSEDSINPETINEKEEDSYVVTNIDASGETYKVPTQNFEKKYFLLQDDGDPRGALYQAKGEGMAIEYNGDLGDDIKFMAVWGPMALKTGDFIISPLPDLSEVYRIARKEFFDTYREKEDQS